MRIGAKQRHEAAKLLSQGLSISDTAKQVGVSLLGLQRLRKDDLSFGKLIDELQAEQQTKIRGQMQELAPDAILTLKLALAGRVKGPGVKAAELVLKACGLSLPGNEQTQGEVTVELGSLPQDQSKPMAIDTSKKKSNEAAA